MTTTISGSNGIVFPDATSMQTGQQAVKAWVNFNGTGTVAIRAGYNVASITDNGTGDYTVNFTTAMQDANYSVSGASQWATTGVGSAFIGIRSATTSMTTTSVQVGAIANGTTLTDFIVNCVSIFR